MADPPRTTARAERTRAAILEAAEVRFAEQGFQATRLADVAALVGIRRASIVYHFKDKRELYEAVLADVFGGLYAHVEPALTRPGPLPERIERAVAAWVDYVGARPSLARLLLREVADAQPGRGPALLAQTAPFTDLAMRVTAEAESDPWARSLELDPAHLASTIAGATLFFVAALPKLAPGPDPLSADQLDAHREQVLWIVRRLLGASPRADGGSS
jgi:TetR/AcrR family transcriptional regulator